MHKHLITSKNAPKTIFCDIDGTLVVHPGSDDRIDSLPKPTYKLRLGGGQRYLINDLKPGRDYDTAISINVERDTGIGDIEI
jgi:hypothetical protein